MRKRIIALALAVMLFVGLQPEPVMASGGEALRTALSGIVKATAKSTTTMHFPNSYNWHFEVPLLNSRTMNDRTFMNNYVYKDRSEFTATKVFSLYDYSRVDMDRPESNLYLAYNNEYYTFNDLASWFAQYRWYVNSNSNWNFRRLVQEGQISYLYSAELRYSRHMHWKKPGWHNRLRDFAQAIFFYGYNESNQIAMLMNNADQSEGSWNSMSTGWKSMPTYSTDNYLNILLTHDERGNCLCGASSVRRSVLVFADTVAPSITSLSVSGKQYYYNKTTNGGKIRFTVNFNEPIRRSDGVVGDDRNFNTEDMRFWVKLAAYDRETRQSVENAYAKLVEANESSLVFEYTVPDDTDMIITGLAGADRQRDCILKDRGTYKMITNNGSYMEVQGNSGWMTSTATFTDFAGNGIDLKWRAVSFSQEIHVDTTTPKISSMAIPSGSMMLGQDTTKLPDGWNANSRDDAGWVDNGIDRSQVFAGTGDWLNLYVDFSEELKDLGGSGAMKSANAKYFVATLNILDGSNNPVKLRGTAAESVKLDINNNIPATRLTFETLRITEDMHPADDSKPIRITDINVEGGGYTNANITDMCGNPIDAATIAGITEVVPKQQEWLDTNAPTIMIGNPTKGGYSGRETIKILINVTENSYNVHSPTLYNSGVTGVGAGGTSAAAGAGTIRLTGMPDESYQWAVTLEDKEPDDGDWKDSNGDTYIEFPQLGTAVYLHLRLKEAPVLPLTDFQITCTGVDWAGNQGTVTETIKATGEGFTNGILLRENVSPSSYVIFDTQINDDGGKDVTARFTVSDKGGLEEVKYKIFVNSAYEVSADTVTVPGWEALIEQARNEGGWTNVQLDPGATSVEVTAGPESCISQYDNCVYLYVYMRDRCGNEWAQSDKFQQDLRMPRFTVTLPRDENGDYVVTEAGKEKIGIGLLDLSDASAMGPVRMASGKYYWSYGVLMLTLVPKQIGGLESPIYGDSKGITKIVDFVLDANQGDKDSKPAPGNAQPQRDDNLYKNIDDVLGELDVADSGGDNIFASDQHHPDLIYPKGYLHYGEGSYPEGVMVGDVGSGYEDTLFKTSASNYVSMNTEEWQTAKEIVEKLKDGYYGELEIHLTEADSLTRGYLGDEWRLEHIPVDEDEKPVYTESYTVKVRTKDYNYKNKYEYYYSKINNVDYGDIVLTNGEVIHSNGWDERTSGYPGRIVEDVPTAFKDLTGIKVNFTLGNNRVPEWGIEDIDFEQSKLVLHYTDQFISGGAPEYEVVREFPLTPDTANQSFIFPDDIEYQDGIYQIEVHLMIKSFQEMEIFNIACPTFNVSTLEPDPDGGIKSVFIIDGQSLKNDTSKELSFYAKNSEDGENVNEFTIPVIQSIDAEGASSSEYFFPFFTYQNMYFNDSTNQVSIVGSGNQKEVVNLMGLKVWTVAEDGTRVDLGEVRYGSDQKQSFLIDPSTTLNTVEEIPSYSYDYKPTNEYLKAQTKNGFTFGLLPSPTYETYKGADGFPNLGEDSGEDVNLMLNAAIKAGETKTFYMQEIYANGEKGSIKANTITAPDITAVPEEGKTTVPVTPVVDVTCSAGVPSDYAYINVNEISSLNGIKSIGIRRNGIEDWKYRDTAFNFSAEVQEVTETEEYENAQGETESVTYTHLMLAVNDTEMSSDSTTRLGEKTENSSGINMQRLLGLLSKASGSNSGKFADPVLVVMDEKYNVTVRALGDLVDDWDPLGTAMEVEAELDYDEFGNVDFGSLVKDGQYTVPLRLTDKFAPKDLDGMTLYISTVDPSSEPAEGETGTITALNTVAIPFSELAKVENYVTPYDGSTPNAPGVTDIKVKSATVPETYGCDWRNEDSYISGGFAYVPDAVDIELEISGSQPDTPLYIYCKDELGHMSISDFYTFEEGVIVLPANTEEGAKPEIIEESIQHADNGSLELKFTQKVTVYDPAIPGGDMTLTAEKTGIPIYKDGVYDITYADIFGKSYTSQIKVALDGDYQFVYSMTPDELTNQQVTFKIDTLSNGIEDTVINGVRVKDPSGADTLAEGTDYTVEFNGEADNKTATVVMQENGIIEVDLQYNQQSTTKRFPITNIDKEMEEVEVVWEYDSYDVYQTREVDNTDTTDDPNDKTIEYVTDGEGNLVLKERGAQTTGYVTAVLQLKNRDSDEVLIGTNGDLRYTFPNLSAAESTYTFEYMDAAGNTGIMEAKLPYSIKLPVPPRLSGYEMDISHTALTQTYNDLSFGYRVREDDVVQTLGF